MRITITRELNYRADIGIPKIVIATASNLLRRYLLINLKKIEYISNRKMIIINIKIRTT